MPLATFFGAIYVPNFILQAIGRSEPELRAQPLAIIDGPPPAYQVVALNRLAELLGVTPGMTKAAVSQFAQVTIRSRCRVHEKAAHAALLDVAWSITPRVEDAAPDTLLIDISGLASLFSTEEQIAREIAERASALGLQVHMAISANVETARIVKDCTETIADEVESVKNLVNAFAQFARFPAAQPVRSDLNEVVEGALAVFAGRLDGIELRTELGANLPPVNIDKEQFKRVVVNLVDNAAESMQDALVKQVRIATRAAVADTVELTVADTGCGVTAEDREKLFLPYFSTKGRGTGLGLAIVNHILADHNAHIRVEENQPAGTRFIIEIPVDADAAEEARAAESAIPATHV